MKHPGPFVELLESPPPQLSVADAQQILLEHWGIAAAATLLSSERDCNFRMILESGQSCLLKVTNAAEEPAMTHLQTVTLRYLADRCPHLPVPRVLPALHGAEELPLTLSGGATHVLRLMSFLPGEAASAISKSPAMRRQIFRTLGELDRGLRDLTLPGNPNEGLLWDVSRAGQVRPLVEFISDDDARTAAATALDRFERDIFPKLSTLRSQIIHNDFNPNNVLLSRSKLQVTGIVDFGDLLCGPVIADLAIGSAYQLIGVGGPIEVLSECVGAYHDTLPLCAAEIEVLFDLVVARLVLIVAITEWRARRHPSNRSYILRNTPGAVKVLKQLVSTSADQVQQLLLHRCGL